MSIYMLIISILNKSIEIKSASCIKLDMYTTQTNNKQEGCQTVYPCPVPYPPYGFAGFGGGYDGSSFPEECPFACVLSWLLFFGKGMLGG